MSKKSGPNLYCKFILYEMGQNFLDTKCAASYERWKIYLTSATFIISIRHTLQTFKPKLSIIF